MSRYKKPDAPKFEPVFIADYRLEARSLATPEDERVKIISEEGKRIAAQWTAATLERLMVLQKHLGLTGCMESSQGTLAMLIAVAEKYVPDFEVHVGAQSKPGRPKVADRFKTVTEIDAVKILKGLPFVSDAIEAVALERRPPMSVQDLNTKYYKCLGEIEACEPAAQLLRFWRETCVNRPNLAQDPFFDSQFWDVERNHMGATVPHNVTLLKAHKR
jgi:hypothetical protein